MTEQEINESIIKYHREVIEYCDLEIRRLDELCESVTCLIEKLIEKKNKSEKYLSKL